MNNAGKNMYEKLTIRDKFMFGKVTKNPAIAQKLVKIRETGSFIIQLRIFRKHRKESENF